MSGRSSRSCVVPVKRNSPFSMNTARSASCSATLIDCSTTTTVSPVAWIRCTTSISWPTTVGARPSESSSMSSSFGSGMRAWLTASICCSPPDRLPACWSMRSASRGNRASTRSSASRTARVVLALEPAGQAEVLPDREGREDALAARHHHHAAAGDLVGGQALQLLPGEGDRPAARLEQVGDALEQGRLAGAVGAEEGDDLALVDVEVQAEEDLHRAVGRVEVLARRGSARARCSRRLARRAPLALRGAHDSAPAMSSVSSSLWSSSGSTSISSTRRSAVRLGTSIPRRAATRRSRVSRRRWTNCQMPPGRK